MKKLILNLLIITTMLSTNSDKHNKRELDYDNSLFNIEDFSFRFPDQIDELNSLIYEKEHNKVDNLDIDNLIEIIKNNTNEYVIDNPNSTNYFEVDDNDNLEIVLNNILEKYIQYEDNYNTLKELRIVYDETVGCSAYYNHYLRLIVINKAYVSNTELIMDTLNHELIHALQYDYNGNCYFPSVLTEASANSFYTFNYNGRTLTYSDAILYEQLFLITGACNQKEISLYYDALFNNDMKLFTEFIGYNKYEEKNLIKLFIDLELTHYIYPINNMPESFEKLILEERQELIGYDSYLYLFERAYSNLWNSSYNLEYLMILSEILNSSFYNILYNAPSQTLEKLNEIYNNFLIKIENKFDLNNDELNIIINQSIESVKQGYFYKRLSDFKDYPKGLEVYNNLDFFDTDSIVLDNFLDIEYFKTFTKNK